MTSVTGRPSVKPISGSTPAPFSFVMPGPAPFEFKRAESRVSTPWHRRPKDVDARNKCGHDGQKNLIAF